MPPTDARFGYIFMVCATGKSAAEMLVMLETRLSNEPGDELRIAAEEQRKITGLQARKADRERMITTHVLDTARGGPAVGLGVILEMHHASEWSPIGRTTTDAQGRVTTFSDVPLGHRHLPADLRHRRLSPRPGNHRAVFSGGAGSCSASRDADAHHHVPLLLSPFGYSTYRGHEYQS